MVAPSLAQGRLAHPSNRRSFLLHGGPAPNRHQTVDALASINENAIDAPTILHTSNERLQMHCARLKKANVIFPDRYF